MLNDCRFNEGNILYFEPFYFKDKPEHKYKYFIVLKHFDNKVILASLPTSQDNVPSYIEKKHGCIEYPSINFNCYYFSPHIKICNNGFSFPKETYVYGFRLQDFDIGTFLLQEKLGKTTITLKGSLTKTEYEAILYCLKYSGATKKKYKYKL